MSEACSAMKGLAELSGGLMTALHLAIDIFGANRRGREDDGFFEAVFASYCVAAWC